MEAMLTVALCALLLAFSIARTVGRRIIRGTWSWLPIGAVAVSPAMAIYVCMQFSSQMVAWGLLLLTPAAIAWALGWIVGFAHGKRHLTDSS
jgi:hypothetical protein